MHMVDMHTHMHTHAPPPQIGSKTRCLSELYDILIAYVSKWQSRGEYMWKVILQKSGVMATFIHHCHLDLVSKCHFTMAHAT